MSSLSTRLVWGSYRLDAFSWDTTGPFAPNRCRKSCPASFLHLISRRPRCRRLTLTNMQMTLSQPSLSHCDSWLPPVNIFANSPHCTLQRCVTSFVPSVRWAEHSTECATNSSSILQDGCRRMYILLSYRYSRAYPLSHEHSYCCVRCRNRACRVDFFAP